MLSAYNEDKLLAVLERIADALESINNLAISQDYWRRVEQEEED